MSTKKLDNYEDEDEFEKAGGDLAQYSSYKEFNVTSKNEELEETAKNLIISLCKVYLERGLVSNEDYVQAVALAEQQNLFILLKQVKYSEHILDSLMLQLDAGGYVDKDIYTTIREMQKSAMQITLEVSKFTRTLPEYLKYVQIDIDKVATSTNILMMSAEQKQNKALESSSSNMIELTESSNNEFSRLGPIRGTRDIMLHMSDVRDDIAKAIDKATDIIATPIAVDDEDDDEPYESIDLEEAE